MEMREINEDQVQVTDEEYEQLCWKCQYSVAYPENKWQCVWEESCGKVIPNYAEYQTVTLEDGSEGTWIHKCKRFEKDCRCK